MSERGLHERLLEHLETAIVVLDQYLQISFTNSAAEVLLEISEQRAKGLKIGALLRDEEDALAGLLECVRTGHSYTQREAKLELVSGNHLLVDYTASNIQSGSEHVVLMEIHPRDRLLRISREEELLAQQETSRMLVRGLAHEIKNPLGGIRGAAQLLDKELKEADLHDYTNIIIAEADRLRNLVDRMLGPNQVFRQEESNIHEILERVISLIEVESKGRIHLRRDYDPSIPALVGDQEQLIQAFLNIARNAMEALLQAEVPDEGAQITFKTRAQRQITIGHVRHRLVLRIEITDNGPGIAPDFLDNIFYPMVSGRAQGTGLGLSITQSIIGQHRGLVECDSEPGNTKFTVFIPLESSNERVT